MPITDFVKNSGFKLLSLLKLTDVQYSIVLYTMNTVASGLNQIVTNSSELSEMLDYNESEIADAIYALSDLNIIRVKYADKTTTSQENPSMSIALNFETSKWIVKSIEDPDKDAIIYPFKRGSLVNLNAPAKKEPTTKDDSSDLTWKRVINYFVQNRSLDEQELASTENAAKMLVETHPVDQILLLIRHFGQRIPTLSLLASSWSHYQETYMSEHHNIDLLSARKKHSELDDQLRNSVSEILSSDTSEFSEEELHVLEILTKHRHPRRQLFWAYQVRAKYPKLSEFFEKNASLMLAVTSSGNLVKR